MNNNRCLFCNKIIPAGTQVCPTCEKEQAEFIKELKSVRNITPENEFCLKCKKKCKGECKEFKEYIKGLLKASGAKRTKRKRTTSR